MPLVQFATQAYKARSTQLIGQEAINCFVETSPQDARTPVPVYGAAGLRAFSPMPFSTGPIRGMHVMRDTLYVISGRDLYAITKDSVLQAAEGTSVSNTLIGTTTIGGLASMADNGRQLVMVDGSVGWIYQPGGLNQVTTVNAAAGAIFLVTNIIGFIASGATVLIPLDDGSTFTTTATFAVGPTDLGITIDNGLPSRVSKGAAIIVPSVNLAAITAEAFQPASTVQYFDGYFVFDAAGTRQFFISELNDGTQYSGLDTAIATGSSFDVMAVRIYHEQLLIFTTGSIEVWWNTGNANFPFQRYDAAYVERGLGNPHAIAAEDNTLFWIGDDGICYKLDGFSPVRISTFAMEFAWSQYPRKWRDASMFVLIIEGHKFLYCTFESGEATWAYDISTQLWAQRVSWGNKWV